MDGIYYIIISIIIGGLIGYFTNRLAILMLFHPRKKILGLKGVIPKRKEKLANKISENIHVILPKEYKKIISFPVIGGFIYKKIKQGIEKSIRETSDEEIESLVKSVVKSELRFIEILGGIIGMLIGLIQGLVFIVL